MGEAKITNATVRMIARVTIPGDSVRIRLDNTFGTAPVTFGSVTVGPRIQGAAIAAGLNKPVLSPFSADPVRVPTLWWSVIEDSGEHYGQLVVYYRANNMVPPASR